MDRHTSYAPHHKPIRAVRQVVGRALDFASVIRPPDTADLCFTGILLYIFLLSSFFRHLPAELAERNSTKSVTWSELSAISKRMSEISDIPWSYKSDAKNHLFFDDFATQRQL